jgi:WS/DGAT/MGAT family acyltransferase
MQRMTGMDAAFLYAETPSMHLQTLGVLVLDPPERGKQLGLPELTHVLESRLHLLPAFRRRAVTIPAGIDHPLWIEDPDFELPNHLHAVTVAPPGTQDELETFVGQVASHPVDRSRPLWEMWILDGFADGSVAIVAKLHHAIMDGAAGAEMLASLFDLSPDAVEAEPPAEPWKPDQVPRWATLVTSSLASFAARQSRVPAEVAHTLSGLTGTVRTWVSQRAAGAAGPLTAPRTPFNAPLSRNRVVSLHDVPLATLVETKNAFGAKINDVVLAASAAALRGYLAARGPVPDRPLIAAVPVADPASRTESGFGNSVSAMLVALPLDDFDPVERLRAAHDRAAVSKELTVALGPDMLRHLTGFVAPAVLSSASRLYSGLHLAGLHPPVANLVISNVAGPPIDLYLAGARLRAAYPLGPVMEGMGVNITVLSASDEFCVGIIADAELVDDVGELGDRFVAAIRELHELALAAG